MASSATKQKNGKWRCKAYYLFFCFILNATQMDDIGKGA